ncbi:MAG: aminotransferase class V-fold PLP-dependent enzyme, partial [Rhodobacteraceae bacterium]|nr:aminotransferase class V-fold PLP-dependent enzyme [Paracoccaceae bacterium]
NTKDFMALGLREHFLLRDDVVFLNHGSFGACPRPIFEDYQYWQLELEKQPVEFMDQHRRSLKLIRNVRERLGDFVGSHPNNLVGVTNATTGLNIVARSLPLKEGDEVLTTDHEYGALEKTRVEALRFADHAKTSLAGLPDHPLRDMMRDLADYVVERIA